MSSKTKIHAIHHHVAQMRTAEFTTTISFANVHRNILEIPTKDAVQNVLEIPSAPQTKLALNTSVVTHVKEYADIKLFAVLQIMFRYAHAHKE